MARYTLDLGPKFDKMLSELAENKETTKSEVIRRAVASYALLNQQTEQGNRISVLDEKSNVVREVLLP